MITTSQIADKGAPGGGRFHVQSRLFAFAALTVAGVALCVYVAYPFLPALAWALALAIMAFPMHRRLAKVIPSESWAAGVSTAVVVALLLIPVLLAGEQLAKEAAGVSQKAEALARDGRAEQAAERVPYGQQVVAWVKQNVDVEGEARALVARFAGNAAALAQGSAWVAIQLLVCVFVLFFAFRDWRHLLASLRGLSPIARDETDYLFSRVSDSVHATVYATVLTSVLQGVTGGLLFWALGLPAPVLWGVVMAILGIIPVLGAFLVWVPAAVYLASEDKWWQAVSLVTWGVLMAGPVSNYAYAYLAGGRLRLHEVPVLVAFVGGLAVFGVSGMVIGPVILAVTLGMLDVWRRRLNPEDVVAPAAESRAAAEPQAPSRAVSPEGAT